MEKHYDSIDGLRTMACIGIVMMHIAVNNNYKISGIVYKTIIPSFTNFVFLFMVVSAFCMCCGYYKKILNGQIDFSDFYKKRFLKIFPFFGFLVLLDMVLSPSVNVFYEAFANLTLLFGFLPNAGNMTVIGVGWFLGLIFVFYICFPFFCVLLENKKRAWIIFGISLIYNFVCTNYFEVGRSNILYSACFFLGGGLIYLYRDKIEKFDKGSIAYGIAGIVFIYYIMEGNTIICLLLSLLLLMYAISSSEKGILKNGATHFFSGISMEVYLSHMFIFRIVEKLGLNTMVGDGGVQYAITVTIVIGGTAAFSVMMQKIITKILSLVKE